MLRIRIIAVGKNKDTWVDLAVSHYLKLLKKHADISFDCVADIKNSKNLAPHEIKKKEAEKIQKASRSNYKIALHDSGKSYDTIEFSEYLKNLMNNSGGAVEMIVGGAYGLDKSILAECNDRLSLSPMTMSHQLIRPVLLEQLFRAFDILSGGKYHK